MRIVLVVLVLALTLYALLDCARTPEESMPARMPKFRRRRPERQCPAARRNPW